MISAVPLIEAIVAEVIREKTSYHFCGLLCSPQIQPYFVEQRKSKIPEPSLGSVRKPLRNGILLFGRFVLVNCQVIWCCVAPDVARPLFLVVVQIALKCLDS